MTRFVPSSIGEMSTQTVAMTIIYMVVMASAMCIMEVVVWHVVMWHWTIVWRIPASIPARIVPIVPSGVPTAPMVTEGRRDIPPWIIVAIIPIEWVIVSNVIPWTPIMESKKRIVETTYTIAVIVLLYDVDGVTQDKKFFSRVLWGGQSQ